jgi:NTE family protein
VLDNYPVKLFDRQRYLDSNNLGTHGVETDYYAKHNQELKQKKPNISPYVFNKETLGFRLDSAREIAVFRDQAEPTHEVIDDFGSYTSNLIKTFLDAQSNQHLHGDDWQRTIYVDTLGVKTTEFKITDAKKEALVKSGRKGTETYFKWFDDPASEPANRV